MIYVIEKAEEERKSYNKQLRRAQIMHVLYIKVIDVHISFKLQFTHVI